MSGAAVAVVSGSGIDLEPLLDAVEQSIPFTALPGLRSCSVAGHVGRYVLGRCGTHQVILQQGRLHVYEGLDIPHVVATVDALRKLGADTVVFTNAAGGLHPGMAPGHVMAVREVHVWPYRGWGAAPERIVPTFVLDGCDVGGAYLWVHGPSYETRSEIAAMQRLGVAAVGMSTAPELARASELGMGTAAVSCITNNCTRNEALTHDHVMAVARSASARIGALVREFVLGM